jgi:hypothetical protein
MRGDGTLRHARTFSVKLFVLSLALLFFSACGGSESTSAAKPATDPAKKPAAAPKKKPGGIGLVGAKKNPNKPKKPKLSAEERKARKSMGFVRAMAKPGSGGLHKAGTGKKKGGGGGNFVGKGFSGPKGKGTAKGKNKKKRARPKKGKNKKKNQNKRTNPNQRRR